MLSYIIGFLLLGGIYDFSVSATAICVVAEILVHYHKKKPVWQKKRNYILWIPIAMVAWSAMVSFWALDMSENMLGILRGVVLLLWMYRCFLLEEAEKQKILQAIPYLGATMVLVGIVSLVNVNLAAKFWQARRLGGFFQYSNTCALFLMLGIVILVQQILQKQNSNKSDFKTVVSKLFIRENLVVAIVFVLLVLGIFLTGSRSILLLLLAWGVCQALKVKTLRVPFAVVSALCLGGAYLYGILAGDNQNIARIFTLFRSNSTILGRILYDIDALSIALKHPFGLGYMGYYYIQPAVQTGVYTTRFVHNDFLQLLVDYGFVALAAGVFYIGYQLLKGKQDTYKKELLVLILVASLVDFHMQYMSILMLLILCLDLGERDRIKKQKELKENYFFCGIALVVSGYLTIAFGAQYLGNNDLALTLFPGYTQAQMQKLNTCADKDEAVALADEILSHNEYVSEAYHTKVYAAAMEGDFETAMECMEHSLAIRRYDVATYQAYDELLAEMIAACNSMDWSEQETLLAEYKEQLPDKLAALEEMTHPIAFKLRDVPVFEW